MCQAVNERTDGMRNVMQTAVSAIAIALVALHAGARPAPSPAMAARIAAEEDVYGIVHWGLNTYIDREWGYGGTMNIGIAPNKDGVLDADEAETLYGWRNGRYFAESVADCLRVEETDSGNVDSHVFAINLRLKKGEGLRYFTATNDMGVAIFTNLNATAQNWLYKPDWSMMRVTRRGPGVPAQWFTCDLASHFFYIKLR
jgi:hypothetical protein